MKKIIAFALVCVLALALVACGDDTAVTTVAPETTVAPVETTEAPVETTEAPVATVMSYAEYAAAELETPVVVEAYVQAHQSWWDNKVTVYAADKDGAYFIYEMACSEEDAALLTPGTLIRVRGYKGAWAGEVEIMDATFEFVDGEAYIAEPVDLTDVLGTDELINYQNQLAVFKDLTVESVEFKNGEPGDDIYVTVSKDGTSYDFCVEIYLTGADTDVYKTVSALTAGATVDVEGFVYWYEGVNTHITGVTVK